MPIRDKYYAYTDFRDRRSRYGLPGEHFTLKYPFEEYVYTLLYRFRFITCLPTFFYQVMLQENVYPGWRKYNNLRAILRYICRAGLCTRDSLGRYKINKEGLEYYKRMSPYFKKVDLK